MKRKIVYFTPDCFLDVDMPVLSGLTNYFDIAWIVLYTHKPEFYKYSKKEITEFAANNNLKLKIYERKYRLRNALNILLLVSMFKYISRLKAGLIYFTAEDDLYFSLLAIIYFPVSKTVKGVHNVILHEKYDSRLKKLTHNLLRKRFNYFHFFSNRQAELFLDIYQLTDHFIARLCNVHRNHSKTYIDREKIITHFIFFGKITRYKGVDLLINATNRLSEKNLNFSVTIAGSCSDWQNYNALIKSHEHLSLNIKMVDDDQLNKYLSQSHFVVLPYRRVTQSGVITVYYNAYIPAIASNLDGFKEYVVNGVNGLTFNSEDVDSLYLSMKKAIEMPHEEYNSLRQNVKSFADTELDKDKITEKYSNFFQSVIERSHA